MPGTVPSPFPLLRICAVAAPTLLLVYGVLRLIDGLDGETAPGFAWNLGHTAFLISFVSFGILLVEQRRLIQAAVRRHGAHGPTAATRAIATLATVAGMLGVAAFILVIVGDLAPTFDRAVPLPGPVTLAAPVLFQLGALTLLVQLAVLRPRQLPMWSPPAVFTGFVLIAFDLDLLPLSALLILVGLAPLLSLKPHPVATGTGTSAP